MKGCGVLHVPGLCVLTHNFFFLLGWNRRPSVRLLQLLRERRQDCRADHCQHSLLHPGSRSNIRIVLHYQQGREASSSAGMCLACVIRFIRTIG